MPLTNLKLLLENSLTKLDIFPTDPNSFFTIIKENFNPLFKECDSLKIDIFKSSLVEFFNALEDLEYTLDKLPYTDPDILDEAKLFISGGFSDLNTYLIGLEKGPDSKELKEKNNLKLTLLKDWAQELKLSIPTFQEFHQEEAKFDRFIIFQIGQDLFAFFENSIQEILHIEEKEIKNIDNPYFSALITHRGEKILAWDRKTLLEEEYLSDGERTRVFLKGLKDEFNLALEVDKIHSIQDLDTSLFTSIEDITGPNYQGSVQFVTLFEDHPLFIFGRRSNEFIKSLIPYELLGDAR